MLVQFCRNSAPVHEAQTAVQSQRVQTSAAVDPLQPSHPVPKAVAQPRHAAVLHLKARHSSLVQLVQPVPYPKPPL